MIPISGSGNLIDPKSKENCFPEHTGRLGGFPNPPKGAQNGCPPFCKGKRATNSVCVRQPRRSSKQALASRARRGLMAGILWSNFTVPQDPELKVVDLSSIGTDLEANWLLLSGFARRQNAGAGCSGWLPCQALRGHRRGTPAAANGVRPWLASSAALWLLLFCLRCWCWAGKAALSIAYSPC